MRSIVSMHADCPIDFLVESIRSLANERFYNRSGVRLASHRESPARCSIGPRRSFRSRNTCAPRSTLDDALACRFHHRRFICVAGSRLSECYPALATHRASIALRKPRIVRGGMPWLRLNEKLYLLGSRGRETIAPVPQPRLAIGISRGRTNSVSDACTLGNAFANRKANLAHLVWQFPNRRVVYQLALENQPVLTSAAIISDAALRTTVLEFVTRDGTVYSAIDRCIDVVLAHFSIDAVELNYDRESRLAISFQ